MRCWRQLGPVAGLGISSWAQPAHPAPQPVVVWTVTEAPAQPIHPRVRFHLTVHGAIEPGWHIYALEEPEGGPLETVLALADGDRADLLHVEQGQPETVMDATFGQRTTMFRSGADFTLQLRLHAGIPPGVQPLHVLVRYQTCNDRVCQPPRTATVSVPLRISQ